MLHPAASWKRGVVMRAPIECHLTTRVEGRRQTMCLRRGPELPTCTSMLILGAAGRVN